MISLSVYLIAGGILILSAIFLMWLFKPSDNDNIDEHIHQETIEFSNKKEIKVDEVVTKPIKKKRVYKKKV